MNQLANYTWDINSPLPTVIQDSNNTYVYGLDLISSTDGAGATTFYTGDGLGSTTDLTNSAGTIIDRYKYDVCGTATHTSGTSANYWQFTGEQSDRVLNPSDSLYYVCARYYDTATGRFMSQDSACGSRVSLSKGVGLARTRSRRFVENGTLRAVKTLARRGGTALDQAGGGVQLCGCGNRPRAASTE